MNSNKINKNYNITKNNLKQSFRLKNINISSSMDLSSVKFKNNLKMNNILPLTKRNKESNIFNLFNYNSNNTSLKGGNEINKELNKENLNIIMSEKNIKIYLKDNSKNFFSKGHIKKEINLSPLQTQFNNNNFSNEKRLIFHSNLLSKENSPKNSIDNYNSNLFKNRINKKKTKKIFINSEKISDIKLNDYNFINKINIDCPEEEHFLHIKINQKLNSFHNNF
jgi:hypothetical protein